MSECKIYYLIKKVDANYPFKNALPPSVLEHVKNKRSQNYEESFFAWSLLNEHFNLEGVSFLESGKPVNESGSFSISHSHGYVGVAFTPLKANLGIDLELIKKRDFKLLKRRFKDLKGEDNEAPLTSWTKREATVKALNLKLFENTISPFKGISKIYSFSDKEFALSIYCDSELEIVEIA